MNEPPPPSQRHHLVCAACEQPIDGRLRWPDPRALVVEANLDPEAGGCHYTAVHRMCVELWRAQQRRARVMSDRTSRAW